MPTNTSRSVFPELYSCPRCRQICPQPHPLADCVHNIAVFNQKKRTALHIVADYVNDLCRNWPHYSAQEQQLAEVVKALHALARVVEDEDSLP